MAPSLSPPRTQKSTANVLKDPDLSPSKMVTDIKAIFITVYSVDMASLLGPMESSMKENSLITE